jgi:hypothetical protein
MIQLVVGEINCDKPVAFVVRYLKLVCVREISGKWNDLINDEVASFI